MGYAPTKELLTADDEAIVYCAVKTCPEIVCEAGEDCGRHGTVCPHCHEPTTPYLAQTDWWQKKYWACSECDVELPGYPDGVHWKYWDTP